jgi:hypothetical protein
MNEEVKEEVKQVPNEVNKEPTLLEKTQKLVDELKVQNDRREQLLNREEQMRANALLSGKSEAGQTPPQPKEETPAEYVKRITYGK